MRLGVIGCGKVVTLIHLNALRRVRQAKIVAVADPVEQRRAQAARRAGGAASCADWQDLLRMTDIDAVPICTPPAQHADCAIQAFANGKHVYIEKPLVANIAEGATVLRAWGCRRGWHDGV